MSAATKAIAVVRTMFFRLIYAQTWILQRLHTIFHATARYHTSSQHWATMKLMKADVIGGARKFRLGAGLGLGVGEQNTSPVGSKDLGLRPRSSNIMSNLFL